MVEPERRPVELATGRMARAGDGAASGPCVANADDPVAVGNGRVKVVDE